MANRPVFFVTKKQPYYQEEMVSFEFNPGFAVVQKQKNIRNIHESFKESHHDANVLEISSKSETELGVRLSAFNLPVTVGEVKTSVECAFQSSKVFEKGGPFTDLLTLPSYMAKKDPRLHASGRLIEFVLNGSQFPLAPQTFFYDWLYVNAVAENNCLADAICEYNAFTDIEFNPAKSINCQARSAAIFVSIARIGRLNEALLSPENFKEIIYGSDAVTEGRQISFF